jgi:hypothetical protein
MYRGIFNRHEADSKGKRQKRGPSVVPAPSALFFADEAVPRLDTVVEESLLALSRELSGLKQTEVPQGAKERGWASLQREMERRPVRPAASAAARSSAGGSGRGRKYTWRWALGGAAAGVAVVATLLATLSGGVPQVVDNGSTTLTSVVSTDSTLPDTTVPTGPVVTGGSSSTDATQPSTTQPTDGTTTTGSSTGTTGPVTTEHTTVTTRPSTTQPTSPTTGDQQNAAQQRIASAEDAAAYLAQLVISGNTSGVGSLVAPGAQAQLSWMVRSLSQPYDYEQPSGGTIISSYVVRISLSINDRIVNGQGELVETVKHFFVRVQVKGESAQIIAINAGS